jgi:nucleotide-binding universal stress UspA family protein
MAPPPATGVELDQCPNSRLRLGFNKFMEGKMTTLETQVRTGQTARQGGPTAFPRVLVHIGLDRANADRLGFAAAFAERFGSAVTGAYLMPPMIPSVIAVGDVLPELIVEQEKLAQADAEAAKRGFLDHATRKGLRTEWHAFRGPVVSRIRHLARCADIAIVGQVDPDLPEEAVVLRPEELALGSGRPVIVVPYVGGPHDFGRRVAVAWNGGREAARAVHDALPFLREAQSVWVVSINPEGESEGHAGPAAELTSYLADHGIKAEPQVLRSDDLSAADALLSRIADLGADSLVMGCFGHSRLREIVLGGMTRDVLRHMTVPVLLSH